MDKRVSKKAASLRMTSTVAMAVSLFAVFAVTATVADDATSNPRGVLTGPEALTKALLEIEGQEKYFGADWGYIAVDQTSGDVLASQNPDNLFDPGSTMKSFAVTAVLEAYGSDYTFNTPVYRAGEVSGNTLKGNLILVGSGDLSFGLRKEPDGSLYYETMPVLNHSYATVGVPGAVEPPGDPLAVFDEFAGKVKAAGILRVDGDVVVDDRLFDPITWPDGLISSIWVNENLIDILVTPGSSVGQPTTFDWRPKTASYTVESKVTTVGDKEAPQLSVAEESPGRLIVTGQLPAGSAPMLAVSEIADPAGFARIAFIEALQRAGVSVAAAATEPNPADKLPAKGSYQDGDRIAEHQSASFGAYVQLIMKVSYNRGADLMACLAAVKAGSTDCDDGIVAEVENLEKLGVSKTAVFPFDGAGSDDHNRASPRALATLYRNVVDAPYAQVFRDALPILGKDGTLGNVLSDSPVAGKAWMKTGNRAVGTPAGQMILLGNTLAGYVEAKSGRTFVVVIATANMPFNSIAEFETVTVDQAKMVEAMQQAF